MHNKIYIKICISFSKIYIKEEKETDLTFINIYVNTHTIIYYYIHISNSFRSMYL